MKECFKLFQFNLMDFYWWLVSHRRWNVASPLRLWMQAAIDAEESTKNSSDSDSDLGWKNDGTILREVMGVFHIDDKALAKDHESILCYEYYYGTMPVQDQGDYTRIQKETSQKNYRRGPHLLLQFTSKQSMFHTLPSMTLDSKFPAPSSPPPPSILFDSQWNSCNSIPPWEEISKQ